MNLLGSFKFALRTIRRNKIRSALTSTGILIGVASVNIVIGLGTSAKVAIKERIDQFGPNSIMVYKIKDYYVNDNDIAFLKKNNSSIEYGTVYYSKRNFKARIANEKVQPQLLGVNNDYFKIRNWDILIGTKFAPENIDNADKVAVIGYTLKEKYFGVTEPIGGTIMLRNVPFRIIGVLKEKGSSLKGSDFDNICIIPYTTFKKRLWPARGRPDLFITTKKEDQVNEAARFISTYLSAKINYTKKGEPFLLEISTEKMQIAETITTILQSLLIGIASISLIVGGIGIMNIMLVSVTERTREIGIRIAIGAKKRDILFQFLIEAVTLCALSGIAGILFGTALYYALVYYMNWIFYFSVISIIASFSFACLIGIFFGFYPAKKAADMNPIDALRFE